MSITLKHAARAFHRVWCGILQDLCAAEEADAGFDAGEFSGKFHADIQDKAYARTTQLLAEKTGYSVDDIMAESYRMDQEFVDRLMAARNGRL